MKIEEGFRSVTSLTLLTAGNFTIKYTALVAGFREIEPLTVPAAKV